MKGFCNVALSAEQARLVLDALELAEVTYAGRADRGHAERLAAIRGGIAVELRKLESERPEADRNKAEFLALMAEGGLTVEAAARVLGKSVHTIQAYRKNSAAKSSANVPDGVLGELRRYVRGAGKRK